MAVGPVGHVYAAEELSFAEKEDAARRLVATAHVPLVLACGDGGEVYAWNEKGRFLLPDDATRVLGTGHPFQDETARDLVDVCRHPDAGQLVLSGWAPEGQPIGFPEQNGAHGGPGCDETRAFALLPPAAPLAVQDRGYLRPLDLRKAAFRVLRRPPVNSRPNLPRTWPLEVGVRRIAYEPAKDD
jgi:hypothetical protein